MTLKIKHSYDEYTRAYCIIGEIKTSQLGEDSLDFVNLCNCRNGTLLALIIGVPLCDGRFQIEYFSKIW